MKKKLFLFAACVSTLALNAMEWQSVFKEDFGGNSLDAPAYGQTVPDGLQTNNYRFYKGVTLPSNSSIEGYATLLKAAEKTYINGKLWSETSLVYGGNQPMTKGSDHTMVGNTSKGYFLYVEGSTSTIYKKTVSIPSGNEKFRVSAWVACAIQWANSGSLKLEVRKPTGQVIGSKILYLGQSTSTLNWKELVVDINDANRNYNSVTVSISPNDKSCTYYAIDDIAVSVWRPTLDITSNVYSDYAVLKMNYSHSELSQFFGNDCRGVIYEWKKKGLNSDKWETLGGGQYYNGANIFFRWSCYIPKRDNGFYKLVFSKNGKTVEQTIEMNYNDDELYALEDYDGKIVTTFRSLDVEDEDSEATADVTVYSDQNQLFVSKEAQEYTIYDMSGRVVAQSNQLPVNISVLKAGVYVVDVDGSRVKFIKK
ncbi:MAG: T9SS type A sorting domain-containing protein [Paludibacteraceae bacterium]|nr:T9SS type A sorting domain-containing protein [Paludibacteraceae bacterium]